ncbi:MAG: protein translocase subunit SecD [Elusimicrobia bacterium]|nr:protein translocase subunit SecD [Elusimicrobiota bacterium]
MSKLHWKWIGILALILISGLFLYPSVEWYQTPPAERQKLEQARLRPRWLLNLGLDLKGGSHLLLELDVAKLGPQENIHDAMDRAIEIIRNRIDQFGVSEPLIARQGERWIVVQLPGITNPERAKELIGKTALLEFRIVDTSETAQKAIQKAAELPDPFAAEGKLNPEIAKLLPPDTDLLSGKDGAYYVVKASAALTGAYLKNARVEKGGDFNLPHVALQFNPEGGQIFDRVTAANVQKNLAIVLDGQVYSAPVIRQRISGGNAIIEGNFQMADAAALAIVLRAGALPAPVRIIEERTVGPSVGEDSIRAGTKACLTGLASVLLFMLFYYRFSGLVANTALILNFLFLMAGMAYFKATLTLPGIAGILLSLAMAVDANVLILERIREELALGKPLVLAITAGYDKAWSAILDSNMTTWIAGIFLFQFGSGPVKGFAVTLTLGILISMFTALQVTRAIYEAWISAFNPKEISI